MSGDRKKANRVWCQAYYEQRATQLLVLLEAAEEAAAVEAKTGQIPTAKRSSMR
jgi:hypothetical protein